MITKTTDGGANWKVQYHSVGKFYFNEISCATEDICMAVAEGFPDDGGVGGCHIFSTTNGGTNWTEVYNYGADMHGSCLPVKMLSKDEAWVGTTYEHS